MATILCTLYNSLYLDKGLVLYDSLKKVSKDFILYVLCMDDKCYEVLSDIGNVNLIPIKLSDFEDEDMLKAKSNRTIAEYCWTCTSALIKYIFATFKHNICTYIDADMYFYNDPQILINEMLGNGKSVMMIPHRFPPQQVSLALKVGTYCVEFNVFKNNADGNKVLEHWHKKCLECCSNIGDGIHWGDQKYMDEWPTLFPDYVHVCEHPGAGIAPWNIELYNNYDGEQQTVYYKQDKTRCDIVFYHFQSVAYVNRRKINTSINAQNKDIDFVFVNRLYYNYLTEIDCKKTLLKDKYNIDLMITHHPSTKTSVASDIKRKIKNSDLFNFLVRKIKPNKEYVNYAISLK